ncbi:hypothetical protein K7X08_035249 [Anisodus acutangulus]|uniref:Uncharacterized protein n=1 Tax=Anisodus acutangulus TaxID=402998 RepID=A0A9Q1LH12_9SOLA|nr:hypothetical protein K7X08_035249 [Anisodus acutangulus]
MKQYKADISQEKELCPIPEMQLEPMHKTLWQPMVLPVEQLALSPNSMGISIVEQNDEMVIDDHLSTINIRAEEKHARKYDEVEPLVMIVDSQGTPIGKDKAGGVEEETANIEIEMNTEQYEPIDRGKECTDEPEQVPGKPNVFEGASSVPGSTNCVSETSLITSGKHQMTNFLLRPFFTSDSKVTDVSDIENGTELKNYLNSFSMKIMTSVTAFPNETTEEMDKSYVVEEDKERVDEPQKEVVENGEGINSTGFIFSSDISLITELDVVTRLQVTYDGKPKVIDVLNFTESNDLVAHTLGKVEVEGYIWERASLVVSSSWKNPLPGENVHLIKAREGLQDKADLMCNHIEAYKDEEPVIYTVVWYDGKMWRAAWHTQYLKVIVGILLPCTLSSDLCICDGLNLTVGEVILDLYRCCNILCPIWQNQVATGNPATERARLFENGGVMCSVVPCFIECISLTCALLTDKI